MGFALFVSLLGFLGFVISCPLRLPLCKLLLDFGVFVHLLHRGEQYPGEGFDFVPGNPCAVVFLTFCRLSLLTKKTFNDILKAPPYFGFAAGRGCSLNGGAFFKLVMYNFFTHKKQKAGVVNTWFTCPA